MRMRLYFVPTVLSAFLLILLASSSHGVYNITGTASLLASRLRGRTQQVLSSLLVYPTDADADLDLDDYGQQDHVEEVATGKQEEQKQKQKQQEPRDDENLVTDITSPDQTTKRNQNPHIVISHETPSTTSTSDLESVTSFEVEGGAVASSSPLDETDLSSHDERDYEDEYEQEHEHEHDDRDKVSFEDLLLLSNNTGASSSSSSLASRSLSWASSRVGDFQRLDCNPETFTDCTTLVSANLPSNSANPLIIPCGQCYTFDLTGSVTLAGGLDIRGKLLFPVNHQATIFTPYVIVQGELELTVDHPTIEPSNVGTNFVLTGTDRVFWAPVDSPNQNACDRITNDLCKLERKPFLVAGGKVNIRAMPETCVTHTSVKSAIYKKPTYDPNDFPTPVYLPSECSISGLSYVSYDFETSYGNWTGRPGSFMVLEDGALRITRRRLKTRGPYLDLTPIDPHLCLVPNQDYLMVTR